MKYYRYKNGLGEYLLEVKKNSYRLRQVNNPAWVMYPRPFNFTGLAGQFSELTEEEIFLAVL